MVFNGVNVSSAMRSYGNTDAAGATSIFHPFPRRPAICARRSTSVLYPRRTNPGAGETSVVQFDVGVEFTHMATIQGGFDGTSVTMGASWTGSNRIRMEMVCLKP
jgi:hypothetical protein